VFGNESDEDEPSLKESPGPNKQKQTIKRKRNSEKWALDEDVLNDLGTIVKARGSATVVEDQLKSLFASCPSYEAFTNNDLQIDEVFYETHVCAFVRYVYSLYKSDRDKDRDAERRDKQDKRSVFSLKRLQLANIDLSLSGFVHEQSTKVSILQIQTYFAHAKLRGTNFTTLFIRCVLAWSRRIGQWLRLHLRLTNDGLRRQLK
jgi:hypothetical protein